jgi:4-diphosphocytidyl-2-C-methyl-D-erythritol kinase
MTARPPLFLTAFAKLNLTLHVTGQRDDGYHLLDSLVCFAAIGDRVQMSSGPLSLSIDGPFATGLQADDDNLCLRAARLTGGDAAIRLTKNLPVASGIGGGSADAAAVLRGMAQMGHAMADAPEQLGADVPVCIGSVTARMQGVGEQITPLHALPPLHLVLVNPRVAVSTPQIFKAMTRRNNPPMPDIPVFADTAALIAWLRTTRNDLQAPAMAIAPVIADVLTALDGLGAGFSRMSGSGATCFGMFDNADSAASVAAALSHKGWWAVATELASPPASR